jgi:tRNA G18 (ribose-2'-O)-methylase SpoU
VLHVEDPTDPRLDDYRHLNDAAARRAADPEGAPHGVVVVEGAVALEQLLSSELQVRSVLLSPTRAAALSDRLTGVDTVYVAAREVLAAVAGFDVHRGVLAAAARPAPADPAAVIGAAVVGAAVVGTAVVGSSQRLVVLEGLSDNENVGAVFRNAAALGIDAVLLDGTCTDPLYRRSIRVSSGWTLRLPFARAGSSAELLALLGAAGVRTLALTPAPEAVPVDAAADRGLFDGAVAFVVGAEGPGLSAATIAACDAAVRVPMAAGVDSLNVATSLAVVAAFAAARRNWSP